MPARRWSIPLEGDLYGDEIFVTGGGRVIASTSRFVEELAPGGLSYIASSHEDPPRMTYQNQRAHRCYAIEPDGTVTWTTDGVHAKCEAPDGALIATTDDCEYVVLDRDGAERARWAMGAEHWWVSGWSGAEPVVTTAVGAVWVEPYLYALRDRHLHRYDAAGRLLRRFPIPQAPFDAECRRRPELTDGKGFLLFPPNLWLSYDARRRRLIASHRHPMEWVASLRLDGTVDWVRLLGDACCNRVCLAGEAIVHTSACDARVSFLSADGAVIRTHPAKTADRAFHAGRGTVCVVARDALRAFDERGEPGWTLELPGLRTATARDGILYAVTCEADRLELIAFDLG